MNKFLSPLTVLFILVTLLSPIMAQPDLLVDQNRLKRDIRTDLLDNNDPCYINEGCVGGLGDRQLIRFTTHIRNVGNQDFVVGNPPANPGLENDIWEYDECHQHWHYESYARYLLYDQANNEIPVGFKNGFCLMDSECSGGGTLRYHCGYQGVSAGCGDIYSWSLPCQWIDVTTIEDGIYRLVNRVNWAQTVDIFGNAETDYTNNEASVCIQLSRNASGNHFIQVLSDDQCNCTDSDGDGVCATSDCDDNNTNFPTTPGTSCNDNNPNTNNDVILADGCTCQGSSGNSNGTTISCGEMSITYGDGQVRVNGPNSYQYKIHDLNNGWNEVFSCVTNCGSSQTASLPNGFYKVKIYGPNWEVVCDTDIMLDGGSQSCIDNDGDGVCADADCDDNNANLPATPGTSCNDNNANTSNDVILADGCTCQGTVPNCADVDGDGVCANVDCDDNNANLPATPGTSCNDGNANTSNDMILADGCTCQGTVPNCADVDGDGVCANIDCDDNNANLPATPGTSCNDNNANTSNDVILADGCTCQGTSNTSGTTISCDELSITYGNGQIYMAGSNTYYFKIHDLNDGWREVFSCVSNCGSTQTAYLPNGFYKVKIYNTNWNPICDTDITLAGTVGPCTDNDDDGICANADCDDNNPNLPTTPGATCNDGNDTTINDQILADGCTCRGTADPGNTTGTCVDIIATTSPNTINLSGLSAPIEIVKIYRTNNGWQQVFECLANCGTTQTIESLTPGNYIIDIQFFSASWRGICTEQIELSVAGSLVDDGERNFNRIATTNNTTTLPLSIYPNPAKSNIWLDIALWTTPTVDVTVYNHLSQVVVRKKLAHQVGMTHSINIPEVSHGIHFVQIGSGKQMVTKKVLIVE